MPAPMSQAQDVLFEPLRFRNLTLKNRLIRSSITGRLDNYDGSGSQARVNWEEKFARGGVGAIVTAHVPVHVSGRILPNIAHIDRDSLVPFWRRVAERVHAQDCKVILQLSHSGRQQDVAGIENLGRLALSATDRREALHGFESRAMTAAEIGTMIQLFVDGARRAREAGMDGIELHGSSGYLITSFLSSAINDRRDEYGGSPENRARFLIELIEAIRKEVGPDYHLQVKLNGVDEANAVYPWQKSGNSIEDSVQICRWAEEAGADAFHVSVGSMFPHPLNSPGEFPIEFVVRNYRSMLGSGRHTFRNYLIFRNRLASALFLLLWNRTRKGRPIEGVNLEASTQIKKAVSVPVICTGGFQTASVIRNAISEGRCDAVSMARTLLANVDLPRQFAAGRDRPERPCTYCNKCMVSVLESPLGCYEVSRFDGDYDRMMREILGFLEALPEDMSNGPPGRPDKANFVPG
jgi:2,4-dienoyl-CoA reductase-like NADH-dependent reductase (Old Yellow Enzyme family)